MPSIKFTRIEEIKSWPYWRKLKELEIWRKIKRFPAFLYQRRMLKAACILLLAGFTFVLCIEFNSTIIPSKDLTNVPQRVKTENYNSPYWTWECSSNKCIKLKVLPTDESPPQSLGVCKLTCGEYRTLWPRPNGELILGEGLISVDPQGVEITTGSLLLKSIGEEPKFDIVDEMNKNFKKKMQKIFGGKRLAKDVLGKPLFINLNIGNDMLTGDLKHSEEAYHIVTKDNQDNINASIYANSFFGAHHGVETLSQLIVYDPYTSSVVMPERVDIKDSPVYPYRGILLDTARNFVTIETIKRTIDGMAVNKLNYLHWHIVDTQSFPFESLKYPVMSAAGAYSEDKVYTQDDIKDVVHYGLVRGVNVIPELDAPAHVGEGWHSLEKQKDELLVCFRKEPWTKFCVEPPCGQLNPVSDKVYEVLGNLYEEMTELFRTELTGIFHMGGDEVNMNCWKHSKVITDWMDAKGVPQTYDGFHEVWDYFQKRALNKLMNVKKKPKRVVIWTSTLTEGDRLTRYLDRNKYIIQIWTKGDDPQVFHLLKNRFPVIFSNTDALYFDCGYGAWVGEGNNWCSPYIGWQKVYENDPFKLLEQANAFKPPEEKLDFNDPKLRALVMGQEAALWTEQADSATVDARIWPRAAAMAERLWANPKTSWRDANLRFLHQRERLIELGINAESIEPEWCYQNEGSCGDRPNS